jgi:NAD(P)-dependent dehydrogenase (short-subunit alcohol dehydrogenase family)
VTVTRSIFITGSSTGLGRATARLFASRGWRVLATMRDPSAAGELGAGVTVLPLDVTEPAQIDAAVGRALELGPVDVVHSNAGHGLAGPLEGTTDAQLIDLLQTNLLGTMRVIRAFIPSFRERGKGLFITTTSIGGHLTLPLNAAYHATKWGLEGFCESLAFELGPFGIGVKTIAPFGFPSELGRSLAVSRHAAYGWMGKRLRAAFREPEQLALFSPVEEIAEVVWEAATDEKEQVTYLAGYGAQKMALERRALGAESFRRRMARIYLGANEAARE